jgi:type 1 fimbriae regulatory protein FimB/type 1 fimbriae regulatory protein FimE
MPANTQLKLVTPTTEIRTVPAGRKTNAAYRSREHLTEAELEKLLEAARANRHGHRDALMVLVAYRHGLRASELLDLPVGPNGAPRSEVNTKADFGSCSRCSLRSARSSSPPIGCVEGVPFLVRRTCAAWRARRMIERLGAAAKLEIKVHPHMLRHACGYALANKGHDTRALQAYLGHRNIQHTVRYTELRPDRFKDFWR